MPGVCADAQCCKITWLEELASESNTIQAQEDIFVSGKIAGNTRPKLCTFVMVFHEYLWIDQFVWARVFCGTRYYQSASVGCSGTIQKIHMRKIRRDQGFVHDGHVADFMIRGRLTKQI